MLHLILLSLVRMLRKFTDGMFKTLDAAGHPTEQIERIAEQLGGAITDAIAKCSTEHEAQTGEKIPQEAVLVAMAEMTAALFHNYDKQFAPRQADPMMEMLMALAGGRGMGMGGINPLGGVGGGELEPEHLATPELCAACPSRDTCDKSKAP